MRTPLFSLIGAAALMLSAPTASVASTATLGFDDLAPSITSEDGVLLTNQYASQGFTFSGLPTAAGTMGSVRAFSSAHLSGSVTPPCDADPATALFSPCSNDPNQGFAGGRDFLISIDNALQFNLLTLSITGVTSTAPVVVAHGFNSATGQDTRVAVDLALPGSSGWSWVSAFDVLTLGNNGDFGLLRSIEVQNVAAIDNIVLGLSGTVTPPPTVPEPASLALALLAIGGGLTARRRKA